MNLSQLLEVLLGRWKVIVMALLGCLCLALAASFVMSKKYEATATLLVDARGADVLGTDRSQSPNQVIMTTQADLVTSERVARRVVTMLKLDADADRRADWMDDTEGRGDFVNYIAKGLIANLTVKPSRDSNVLSIVYTSSSPAKAAATVNAFARASIDTNLELKVEPAKVFTGWFDERTKILRANLEAAQERLTKYQRDNGLLSAGEGRVDIENAKLAQLTNQLIRLQETRAESNSRQTQAAGNASASPDVLNNAVIANLRTAITTAEANLTQMRSQYGESHPSVENAKQHLVALRAQLDSEMKAVARSLNTNNAVNAQREAEASAALEAQRAKVLSLMNQSSDALVLQRDVESAQRALEAVTTRQSQTLLESQQQQTNVYLLTSADEPTSPSKPRIKLNLAMGAAFGLLLGLALALWLEARTPLIRSVDDLLAIAELPVLAALPHASTTRKLAATVRRLPPPAAAT
jgi:succinoglycan biosynthesis transport protein ExoP